MLCIRRLQILLRNNNVIDKNNLHTLGKLLGDILQYKPFHLCREFHRAVIKLYIVTKLLYVDCEELQHDTVLDNLPYFNWSEIKQQFNYQDEYFSDFHSKLIKAAHESIEASVSIQASSPMHLAKELRLEAEKCLRIELPKLQNLLMDLIPTTSLERLIGNRDVQEYFTGQKAPEFKILLKTLGQNITEPSLNRVMETFNRVRSQGGRTEQLQDLNALEMSHNNIAIKDGCKLKNHFHQGGDTQSKLAGTEIESTSSGKTINTSVDLIILNGKIWNVKRGNVTSKLVYKIGDPRKNQDVPSVDMSSDNKHVSKPLNDIHLIIHNSKRYECVSKICPQVVQKPKSSEHLMVCQTKTYLMRNNLNNFELKRLEKTIKTLETYLTLLKAKFEKEKINAGLQSYRDDDNSSGTRGGNLPNHDLPSTSAIQELTHQNDHGEGSHQIQGQSTGEDALQLTQTPRTSSPQNIVCLKTNISYTPNYEKHTSDEKEKWQSHQNKYNTSLYADECDESTPALRLSLTSSPELEMIPESPDNHEINVSKRFKSGSIEVCQSEPQCMERSRNNEENKLSELNVPYQNSEVIENSNSPSVHSADLNLEDFFQNTDKEDGNSTIKHIAIAPCASTSTSPVSVNTASRKSRMKRKNTESRSNSSEEFVEVSPNKKRTRGDLRKRQEAEGAYEPSLPKAKRSKTKHVSEKRESARLKSLKESKSETMVSSNCTVLSVDLSNGMEDKIFVTLLNSQEPESGNFVTPVNSPEIKSGNFVTPVNSPEEKSGPPCSISNDNINCSDSESWKSARNDSHSSHEMI
ncbi:uncharacterized protein [Procambarus clarkii]